MRLVRITIVSALLLVMATGVRAKDAAPVSPLALQPLPSGITVPRYVPGVPPFHPGQQLDFKISWIGLPAAIVRVRLIADPSDQTRWIGELAVMTTPVVDVFYRLRGTMREELDSRSLAAGLIEIHDQENRHWHEYHLQFDHAHQVVEMKKYNHKGLAELRRFSSANPTGMISGALMALSQPLKVGRTMVFDTFSAANRYVLQFKIIRRETIHTGLGDFRALRIEPAVLFVSDRRMRDQVSAISVWVSDDERRWPLRIAAASYFGNVTIDLAAVGEQSADKPVPKQR